MCQGLRPRGTGCALALTRALVLPSTTRKVSASRTDFLSRLNTWPTGTPVNASSPTSRRETHDSGPMGFALTVHRKGFAPSPPAGLPAHPC
jgi:hypothetical protein